MLSLCVLGLLFVRLCGPALPGDSEALVAFNVAGYLLAVVMLGGA